MSTTIYKVLNYNVHLCESVNTVIHHYIQNSEASHESGGILLGEVKNNNIYIQKATIPNKYDKSSRYSFKRDKEIAQIILDYERINSSNTITYLGEWHTHPENYPNPSDQDKKMIRDQLLLGKLNLPFVILLIQGIKSQYISLFSDNNLAKAEKQQ